MNSRTPAVEFIDKFYREFVREWISTDRFICSLALKRELSAFIDALGIHSNRIKSLEEHFQSGSKKTPEEFFGWDLPAVTFNSCRDGDIVSIPERLGRIIESNKTLANDIKLPCQNRIDSFGTESPTISKMISLKFELDAINYLPLDYLSAPKTKYISENYSSDYVQLMTGKGITRVSSFLTRGRDYRAIAYRLLFPRKEDTEVVKNDRTVILKLLNSLDETYQTKQKKESIRPHRITSQFRFCELCYREAEHGKFCHVHSARSSERQLLERKLKSWNRACPASTTEVRAGAWDMLIISTKDIINKMSRPANDYHFVNATHKELGRKMHRLVKAGMDVENAFGQVSPCMMLSNLRYRPDAPRSPNSSRSWNNVVDDFLNELKLSSESSRYALIDTPQLLFAIYLRYKAFMIHLSPNKRGRKPIVRGRENALLKLRSEGFTYESIGSQFGCSRQAIHQALKKASQP